MDDALSAGAVDAEEWDRFLETLPDADHQQASSWSDLKATRGWGVARFGVWRGGVLVAGMQMLHRTVLHLWRLGYVPRGPVFSVDDARVSVCLLQSLEALLSTLRVRYLVLQPARSAESFAAHLRSRGFRETPVQVAPTSTVRIDLSQSEQELLAAMRPSARRGIGTGEKSGLRVRQGGASDLPAFHALLDGTARRRGFTAPSIQYLQAMWAAFSGECEIVLFLVELGEELVAAELDIAFGDTLVSKRAGWSGRHKALHPNELVIWSAMRWAKARGMRWYDLDGLHPELAAALVQGKPPPPALQQSHHGFKAGFGGEITILPCAYELVRMPVLGWLHREAWCRWLSLEQRRWLLQRIGVA